jgi:hypothetical protein
MPLNTRASFENQDFCMSLAIMLVLTQTPQTGARIDKKSGLFSRIAIVRQRKSEQWNCVCSRDSQACLEMVGSGSVFKDFWAAAIGRIDGRGDTCRCLAGCQGSRIDVAGASYALLDVSASLTENRANGCY